MELVDGWIRLTDDELTEARERLVEMGLMSTLCFRSGYRSETEGERMIIYTNVMTGMERISTHEAIRRNLESGYTFQVYRDGFLIEPAQRTSQRGHA